LSPSIRNFLLILIIFLEKKAMLSFVIYLGVILLISILFGNYINQRLQDQNHKIVTLASILTTLTKEFQHFKNGKPEVEKETTIKETTLKETTFKEELQPQPQNLELLIVSDDEEDEEDDEDDDDNNFSLDKSLTSENMKIIQFMNAALNDMNTTAMFYTLECSDNFTRDDNFTSSDNKISNNVEQLEDDVDTAISGDDVNGDGDAVNVDAVNVDEYEDDVDNGDVANDVNDNNGDDEIDYKKLNVDQLRKLVQEKQLTSKSSKMKKNDLITLLSEADKNKPLEKE
jgi:hypothetical protein